MPSDPLVHASSEKSCGYRVSEEGRLMFTKRARVSSPLHMHHAIPMTPTDETHTAKIVTHILYSQACFLQTPKREDPESTKRTVSRFSPMSMREGSPDPTFDVGAELENILNGDGEPLPFSTMCPWFVFHSMKQMPLLDTYQFRVLMLARIIRPAGVSEILLLLQSVRRWV